MEDNKNPFIAMFWIWGCAIVAFIGVGTGFILLIYFLLKDIIHTFVK